LASGRRFQTLFFTVQIGLLPKTRPTFFVLHFCR